MFEYLGVCCYVIWCEDDGFLIEFFDFLDEFGFIG